ncbi:MAG: ester cyclase [Chitinophagaceae bacterium]
MKTLTKGLLLSIYLLICINLFAQSNTNLKSTLKQEVKMEDVETQEKNKEIIRKLYDECYNKGKFDLLKDIVAEDFTGAGGQKGAAGFAEPVKVLAQAFPDIKFTIEHLVAEGDLVVARSYWKGTHTASFRNFPPTNKFVNGTGIGIYQLKNNKIVNIWLETDRLGFWQQIDVLPQNIVPTPKK